MSLARQLSQADGNVGSTPAGVAGHMENGLPNRELVSATVGSVFARILDKRQYLVVRAFGEMVDPLWKAHESGVAAFRRVCDQLTSARLLDDQEQIVA